MTKSVAGDAVATQACAPEVWNNQREATPHGDDRVGIVCVRVVGLGGVRMDLHSKLLTMLEQPNVEAVQLVPLHAHPEPVGKTGRGFPRDGSPAHMKSGVFRHPPP